MGWVRARRARKDATRIGGVKRAERYFAAPPSHPPAPRPAIAKLAVLMVTAFVDMVGLLMVLPLLPYYAVRLGGGGFIVGILVSSFAVAQLLSAPVWGRVSDRYGRRPAILVSLAASAVAYVVFGYADSLGLLLASRLIQGAGGGTTGVIQAYVTDATEPGNRARSLGWLSAATSVGVTIGPVIGSFTQRWGYEAPGLFAAGLCIVNIVFAWFYLRESHEGRGSAAPGTKLVRSREAVAHVAFHPTETAPRLIWIYGIAMGAFQMMTAVLALFLAARYGVDEANIGYFFMYVGALSVLARAVLLGPAVDRLGEARLSRVGSLLLAVGLATIPLTHSLAALALAMALVPLGTAFTFPCVTSLLSRVIGSHERGLYLGVQQTFGGVARVVGPLWAGWAWDHLGTAVPFWSGAVLVLASLALGAGLERAGEAISPSTPG
jgi:MFS family permease